LNCVQEINKLIGFVDDRLKIINEELMQLPPGKLSICVGANKTICYVLYKENGKHHKKNINSQKELISIYARKEYLLLNLKLATLQKETLLSALQSLQKNEINNIYKDLPKHFDTLPKTALLTPTNQIAICPNPTFDTTIPIRQLSKELYNISAQEWMQMKYRQNQKEASQKACRAESGLMLRTKGELEWANLLTKYGLPYHYDELMAFFKEWISPDFVVLRADGKLIYIEHCGLIANKEYMENLFEKLRMYRSAGITLGDNLILTFDNPAGGIDVELMKAELKSKQLIL